MIDWYRFGWWVHKLPIRLERWLAPLGQHIMGWLQADPPPSRHAWSTAFHAVFMARFPQWNAFMLAQNAHQRLYMRTYWRDLETAFMAQRPKELRLLNAEAPPLGTELDVFADGILLQLLSLPDPIAPWGKLVKAYDSWEEEQRVITAYDYAFVA